MKCKIWSGNEKAQEKLKENKSERKFETEDRLTQSRTSTKRRPCDASDSPDYEVLKGIWSWVCVYVCVCVCTFDTTVCGYRDIPEQAAVNTLLYNPSFASVHVCQNMGVHQKASEILFVLSWSTRAHLYLTGVWEDEALSSSTGFFFHTLIKRQ